MRNRPVKGSGRLPRRERLKNNRSIAYLFHSGSTLNKYPLKAYYNLSTREGNQPPSQFAVTIPVRNFKKAVDRNLLKRRIREAYRLNKESLLQQLDEHQKILHLIIVYTAKELMDYKAIERSMQHLLRSLGSETG